MRYYPLTTTDADDGTKQAELIALLDQNREVMRSHLRLFANYLDGRLDLQKLKKLHAGMRRLHDDVMTLHDEDLSESLKNYLLNTYPKPPTLIKKIKLPRPRLHLELRTIMRDKKLSPKAVTQIYTQLREADKNAHMRVTEASATAVAASSTATTQRTYKIDSGEPRLAEPLYCDHQPNLSAQQDPVRPTSKGSDVLTPVKNSNGGPKRDGAEIPHTTLSRDSSSDDSTSGNSSCSDRVLSSDVIERKLSPLSDLSTTGMISTEESCGDEFWLNADKQRGWVYKLTYLSQAQKEALTGFPDNLKKNWGALSPVNKLRAILRQYFEKEGKLAYTALTRFDNIYHAIERNELFYRSYQDRFFASPLKTKEEYFKEMAKTLRDIDLTAYALVYDFLAPAVLEAQNLLASVLRLHQIFNKNIATSGKIKPMREDLKMKQAAVLGLSHLKKLVIAIEKLPTDQEMAANARVEHVAHSKAGPAKLFEYVLRENTGGTSSLQYRNYTIPPVECAIKKLASLIGKLYYGTEESELLMANHFMGNPGFADLRMLLAELDYSEKDIINCFPLFGLNTETGLIALNAINQTNNLTTQVAALQQTVNQQATLITELTNHVARLETHGLRHEETQDASIHAAKSDEENQGSLVR